MLYWKNYLFLDYSESTLESDFSDSACEDDPKTPTRKRKYTKQKPKMFQSSSKRVRSTENKSVASLVGSLGDANILPNAALGEIVKALGLSVEEIQKHGGTVAVSVPESLIKDGVLDLTHFVKSKSNIIPKTSAVPTVINATLLKPDTLANSSKY